MTPHQSTISTTVLERQNQRYHHSPTKDQQFAPTLFPENTSFPAQRMNKRLQHSTPSSFLIDRNIRSFLSRNVRAHVRSQTHVFLVWSQKTQNDDLAGAYYFIPKRWPPKSIADWLSSGASSLDWPNLAAKKRGPVARMVSSRASVRTELVSRPDRK